MIANYHTHTWRCKHAEGIEREYIEKAIDGGLKILGFSDHTPMPYPKGYVSDVKMDMNQLEDYVDTILKLKAEYRKDMEIHLGLEVEYYPRYLEELLKAVHQYPIEYFLLAQHYLGNEINDFYSGTPTDSEEYLKRYCMQSQEALETGLFTYFAHPDLLNFSGNAEIYHKWMHQLCSHAKRLDIPLEINFLGIRGKRHYPNPDFWKIAGDVGNKVIFGADAHQPKTVWDPEILSAAKKMVDEFGLNLIDTVTFRKP
ncbi:histidinol-phosphatase [Parablautia muri]|uniref:Histidinol-phosphatase n=1 Tax=Parablautia muri TaxID=2320879 RepID=A0A9X5GSE7_9FIRM|nr:histidinol-phosphatase [Parablautia muri]NBJ92996.1 histidinol-phosphatase HisJ family protein [Parablautia muri]